MIFAIPREETTYIGTTDTDFYKDKEKVITTKNDAEYLLTAVNLAFPGIRLTMEDIISSWAGLRPLINQPGRKTSEISRKDEIFISDTGLISIAGGKLTGYRKMSLKIVNLVSRVLKKEYNIYSEKCRTRFISLKGNQFSGSRQVREYINQLSGTLEKHALGKPEAVYLVHNYGIQTEEILSIMKKMDEKDPSLKLILAELKFCSDYEMIVSAVDFLVRRTGRMFFKIESVKKYSEPVLMEMAKIFEWSQLRLSEERNRLENEIFKATHFE
jgi:glycerol-3-phosphate dehydrogenase